MQRTLADARLLRNSRQSLLEAVVGCQIKRLGVCPKRPIPRTLAKQSGPSQVENRKHRARSTDVFVAPNGLNRGLSRLLRPVSPYLRELLEQGLLCKIGLAGFIRQHVQVADLYQVGAQHFDNPVVGKCMERARD